MKICGVTLIGAVILAVCALRFATQSVSADDKYLTREEADKLGMKVELVTPKPKVVYATLRFEELPKDAQLVIRDEKDKWIANTSMAITEKACAAFLAEEYVGRSYFLVTDKPGGHTFHVPLR